jgi:uncharacterized protein (TIGR02118 family)
MRLGGRTRSVPSGDAAVLSRISPADTGSSPWEAFDPREAMTMVKLIGCLKRKPGLTSQEFHRYWREEHYPLAKSVPEFFRYIRKYVQSHALEGPVAGLPGYESAFDGFAEIWFDSLDDMGRVFAESRYREIIRADEKKFLDLPNCKTAIVEELALYSR